MTAWDLRRYPTREHLAQFADDLLEAVRPYASPGKALITLPGSFSSFGARMDGLEGFTRTLLAAGFLLKGNLGDDPKGHLEFYARGIETGTHPEAPDRWPTLTEHSQPRVEAAALALILDLTRPWLWDQFDAATQRRIIAYLAPAVTDDLWFAPNNWIWFRIVINTFLRSVGGPYDAEQVRRDLEQHEQWCHDDGWIQDGDARNYDYYTGWALHMYPVLWQAMQGAECPDPQLYRERLDAYLQDFVTLIGAEGAPLFQGRSLTYRFAAAAPLWAGAAAGVTSVPLGELRDTALALVQYFIDHGAPDHRGLLPIGWHHEYFPIAQTYSGTGSPYWAAKGLLGLMFPATHPVWSAPSVPATTARDVITVVKSPGWLVSATAADGVVRVYNHGTDRALPAGSETPVENHGATATRRSDSLPDDPFYGRLAYSTHTAPLLDDEGIRHPLDQTVALLDDSGRASHRTGFEQLTVTTVTQHVNPPTTPPADAQLQHQAHSPLQRDAALGVGMSRARAHWVSGEEADPAGIFTVVSVVRGTQELRCVKVSSLDPRVTHIRLGGWALPAPVEPPTVTDTHATARSESLISSVIPLTPGAILEVDVRRGASPFDELTHTPYALYAPQEWMCVVLQLGGGASADMPEVSPCGDRLKVTWGAQQLVVDAALGTIC